MSRKTRFVLAGFGNVGGQIAEAVIADPTDTLEIAAIAARDLQKAQDKASAFGLNVPIISAAEASKHADIIVECATYDSFRDVVEPALIDGCHVIAVSVGALAQHLDLIDLADQHGATLQISSGTLPGLDILRAAREGNIRSVKLESQILPRSFAHEAYIAEQGIDLERAESEPVFVFSGTAREAARHFPRHFNVAVSLSLAGIGLDRTQVEIHAYGKLTGARHTIKIESDVVKLEMTSQNFPSPQNNRTSRVVAPSIIAALRELSASIRVGS